MITDIDQKRVLQTLKRNTLAEYWGGYFAFAENASNLHEITRTELRMEITRCKSQTQPFVDSQVVISNSLGRLSSRHTFHRQFSEQFPDLHPEQILGMQLYTLMLEDDDVWMYIPTHHEGHVFPHATYLRVNT